MPTSPPIAMTPATFLSVPATEAALLLDQGVRELQPAVVARALAQGVDLNVLYQGSDGRVLERPLVAVCASDDRSNPVSGQEHLARTSILDRLLAAGAPVDGQDLEGYTPLAWSAIHNRWDLVMRLIEAGADPHVPDPAQATVLDNALQDRGGDGPALLDRLLAAGLDPVRQAHSGHLTLAQVISPDCVWPDTDRARALDRLITAGLDLLEPPGEQPWIQQAVERGLIACLGVLLAHGAAITVIGPVHISIERVLLPTSHRNPSMSIVPLADEGWGLLHRAAYRGHRDVVQRLLELGMDPNLPSQGGITPLHTIACRARAAAVDRALADLLIDAGASIDAPSALLDGHTPLSLAAAHPDGHGSLLRMEAVVLRRTLPSSSAPLPGLPRPRL